jgi:hypothetical protein
LCPVELENRLEYDANWYGPRFKLRRNQTNPEQPFLAHCAHCDNNFTAKTLFLYHNKALMILAGDLNDGEKLDKNRRERYLQYHLHNGVLIKDPRLLRKFNERLNFTVSFLNKMDESDSGDLQWTLDSLHTDIYK